MEIQMNLAKQKGERAVAKQVLGTNRCVFAVIESQLLESLRVIMLHSYKDTKLQR